MTAIIDYEVELVSIGNQPQYLHLTSSRVMRIPYVAAADEEQFASIALRVSEIPISDAVTDTSDGCAQFGLDIPRGELRVRDFEDELHLLIGATVDGQVYLKIPATRGVNTVPACNPTLAYAAIEQLLRSFHGGRFGHIHATPAAMQDRVRAPLQRLVGHLVA